ncbi:MAG: Gx transporter family protein [Oscillospiraceae bacterium]
MGQVKTRDLTRLALLTAVALALGYAEQFIPIAPGLPGVKLGLANTVLLYALYLMDVKSAVFLMVLKIFLSGLLYAGFGAMIFSFAGGILSLVAMVLVKKLGRDTVSVIGVSVIGAVFHNVGQLLVSALVVNTVAMLYYLPMLLISAVITGILTGVAAKYVMRGLNAAHHNPKQEGPQ